MTATGPPPENPPTGAEQGAPPRPTASMMAKAFSSNER